MSDTSTDPESEPFVRRTDRGAVATLTLDRPGQRNALSIGMLEALDDVLATVDGDRAVHVVVLEGAGPAFSAGHDLREITDRPDAAYREHLFAWCAEVMLRIGRLRQPVIAKVHGVATAAGCQLVAAADLAVAGQSARFATPGVNIGLFCSTPAVALSRAVAPKHAMELLLTGELIGADEAFRIGLVNRVVADDALDDEVAALAALIASKPSETIASGKAAFRRQLELPLGQAYADASAAMIAGLATPEAAEGIGAFLAKRPPVWGAP
jgi:enoyl-CoA hydratase/carnithine racemase